MMEQKISASRFDARMKTALRKVLWAFERFDCEESLLGPVFARVIAAGAIKSFDMDIMRQSILETAAKLRKSAEQLEDAARDMEMAQLDLEAATRNGP